jgi:(1->4)-alpha-D-glucan 1-alpha-D-glucosylmutase
MTHDAKRSADVRARIGTLTAMPDVWARAVERFFAVAEPHRTAGTGPDDVESYFLFQILVGVWPIELDRLDGYIEKSLREAKRTSNWIEPNTDREEAVKRFTRKLVADPGFMTEFEPLRRTAATAGERAALGQLALKLTVPGVPDTYQGDELEYRALVDPDNRRPVDWQLRQALLRRLMGGGPPGVETRKLSVLYRLLGLRARRPELFAAGAYEPVEAGSETCAFVRGGELLTVVSLRSEVSGTLRGLPGGRWSEVLTGDERSFDEGTPVSNVLGPYGLAVYARV